LTLRNVSKLIAKTVLNGFESEIRYYRKIQSPPQCLLTTNFRFDVIDMTHEI